MVQKLFGGIEFGGTKTICAIGDISGKLVAQTTVPTTDVEETLGAVYEFFAKNSPVVALGVGAFGPLNLDANSTDFGYIYNAPKPGWSRVDLLGLLGQHFKLPVKIDLDVNCAALGEQFYGVAKDVNSFVYLTIGTGVGGSLIINNEPFHGILNLEMGHMRIPYRPLLGAFKGACTFHMDCFEGLASGYAMEQQYGKKGEEISDATAWNLEAEYVASALNNLMLTIGPEKIILGGGLINHTGLIEGIRKAVQKNINNYLEFPKLESYIIKSSGKTNGVRGAIKLATLA